MTVFSCCISVCVSRLNSFRFEHFWLDFTELLKNSKSNSVFVCALTLFWLLLRYLYFVRLSCYTYSKQKFFCSFVYCTSSPDNMSGPQNCNNSKLIKTVLANGHLISRHSSITVISENFSFHSITYCTNNTVLSVHCSLSSLLWYTRYSI